MPNPILNFIISVWMNFIIIALPLRIRETFTELLMGRIVAGSEHLTQALLAGGFSKHYSTYNRLITEGKWS